MKAIVLVTESKPAKKKTNASEAISKFVIFFACDDEPKTFGYMWINVKKSTFH